MRCEFHAFFTQLRIFDASDTLISSLTTYFLPWLKGLPFRGFLHSKQALAFFLL